MIKDLNMGDYCGLVCGPSVITRILIGERQENQETDVMAKAEVGVM